MRTALTRSLIPRAEAWLVGSPTQLRKFVAAGCKAPTPAGAVIKQPVSSLRPTGSWCSDCGSTSGRGGGGSGGVRRNVVTSSGGGGGGGMPSSSNSGGLWSQYLQLLETHPTMTRMVTCALLNGLGDLICQLFFEAGDTLDWKRLAKFTGMGFFVVAPILNIWYTQLNARITMGGAAGAALRMALDQLLFAPIFLSIFLSVLFAIDGKADAIRPKLEQDLWSTVQANWVLWVPAQFLNFRFVPPSLNMLCTNVTALIWNVYMSHASHKEVGVVAAAKA